MTGTSKKYRNNFHLLILNQIQILIRKFMSRIPEELRNPIFSRSLKKYDRRAGTYVSSFKKLSIDDQIGPVVSDGQTIDAPRHATFLRYLDWLASEFRKLGTENASILEVGAGELTTLAPLVQRIADPTLKVHAAELCWSRCRIGRNFADELGIQPRTLVSANMTELPYASNSVDYVFTNGALEELGGFEREAIGELYRVARRAVLILEASYELGNPAQRRKLRYRRWNVGIIKAVKTLGLPMSRHELVPYSDDPYHRLSLIMLTKPAPLGDCAENELACPKCKGELFHGRDAYFCEPCGYAFPILQGIPVFLGANAIVASLYKEQSKSLSG